MKGNAWKAIQLFKRNTLWCDPDKGLPSLDGLAIEEVARGLSRVPRFVGQCRTDRTVAMHSLTVYDAVKIYGGTERHQLLGLMHDAHEMFTGDIPSPLKAYLPNLKTLERHLDGEISRCLGTPLPSDSERLFIKQFDLAALALEAEAYVPIGAPWRVLINELTRTVPPRILHCTGKFMSDIRPEQAYGRFKSVLEELTK